VTRTCPETSIKAVWLRPADTLVIFYSVVKAIFSGENAFYYFESPVAPFNPFPQV